MEIGPELAGIRLELIGIRLGATGIGWELRGFQTASTGIGLEAARIRLGATGTWFRADGFRLPTGGIGFGASRMAFAAGASRVAAAMGVEILTEEQYLELQKLGEFDTKRSSWIKTPDDMRKLGGALYCDRRYGRVFVGQNGADFYSGGRGFRGSLRV